MIGMAEPRDTAPVAACRASSIARFHTTKTQSGHTCAYLELDVEKSGEDGNGNGGEDDASLRSPRAELVCQLGLCGRPLRLRSSRAPWTSAIMALRCSAEPTRIGVG